MLNKKNNGNTDDKTERKHHNKSNSLTNWRKNVASTIEFENQHFATPNAIISLVNHLSMDSKTTG